MSIISARVSASSVASSICPFCCLVSIASTISAALSSTVPTNTDSTKLGSASEVSAPASTFSSITFTNSSATAEVSIAARSCSVWIPASVVSATTASAVWIMFEICTEAVITVSTNASSAASSRPNVSAASSSSFSPEPVAKAQGSIEVTSSAETPSGNPSAINIKSGLLVAASNVLTGVTVIVFVGSVGIVATIASEFRTLPVIISLPPIDTTRRTAPSSLVASGKL